MKKVIGFVKNNMLLIFLTLQPFLDVLAYFQRDFSVSLAGYFRLAVTVVLPVYTIFFTKQRKKYVVAMSVIVGFCALHILNGFRVGYNSLFLDVKYMLLVCHAIVVLFSFMFLYEKEDLIRQIKLAMQIVIATVVISYYLSYILKSGSHTYVDTYIGWTGWNNTPSVFSIILSALLPFAVCFCVQEKSKWWLLALIPVCYIYILNGTKAAYLTLIGTMVSVALFLAAEFFIKKTSKMQFVTVIVLLAIMAGSVFVYNYSPRSDIDGLISQSLQEGEDMLDKDKEDKDEDEDEEDAEFEKNFASYLDKNMIKRFGKENVLEKYKGNMNAQGLADNRLKKIIFGSLVWEKTDTLTKFVGFEQSLMYIGNETYDLESDPQAIFFYYGYIGTALYAALLLYFWLRLLKQLFFNFKESFSLFNFIIFINYGLLMVSAIYTGHLLRRPNSAIYLAVVLLLIYCRTEPLFKKKTEGQK